MGGHREAKRPNFFAPSARMLAFRPPDVSGFWFLWFLDPLGGPLGAFHTKYKPPVRANCMIGTKCDPSSLVSP
jgi:hypothetical protein